MSRRGHGWMLGAALVAAGMVQVALVVARAVSEPGAPAAAVPFRPRAPDAPAGPGAGAGAVAPPAALR